MATERNDTPLLPEQFLQNNSETIIQNTKSFSNLMMRYRCAIREVQTKLEILDDEFSNTYQRNPIASIQTRIKKPFSIYNKLTRKGYEVTLDNITEHLNDVAGIRVTCPFITDIYEVAGLLAEQDDISVLSVKDYIKNPKPNGYRSYHMIVEIPVFFSSGKTPMKVEVQVRTIAMDFWASLEHQIHYKKNVENIHGLESVSQELKDCADAIAKIDAHMLSIKEMIGEFQDLS
ncbi:MAG: GTP pyrophosphokinase [Lachnospiraceae bacterium]